MKSKMSEMGLIVLDGAKEFGKKVDGYLKELNQTKNSFILDMNCPRFGTGEAKCHISESVRGKDIYILLDICNYSIKYTVCGIETVMSPDDHYQDLKRVISAISGKARRISVIMPFLYESRQHKRSSRESLDCALMLHELENMGVDNIITFDAHDPRVQNALFKTSFESVPATYQFIKTLLTAEINGEGPEPFSVRYSARNFSRSSSSNDSSRNTSITTFLSAISPLSSSLRCLIVSAAALSSGLAGEIRPSP